MIEFIAGAVIGLVIGLYIGLRRHPPQDESNRYESRLSIQVGPSSILFLRSVDNARLKAMAARWAAGRPLTFTAMVGRGKIFSRSQWVMIRKELINRGLFDRRRDGSVYPTPSGESLLKSLTGDMHGAACTRANRGVLQRIGTK